VALWGRQVRFEVGQSGSIGFSISDLRVMFRITHTQGGAPSQATISIFNLQAESIAEFQREDAIVRLFAGYDVPLLIFQGSTVIDGVSVDKRGPDRVLNVKAQDGLIEVQQSQVDVTLDGETTLMDILTEALGQLGLPIGPQADLPDTRFQDYTFHGDASDLLDRVASMGGVDWTIRDGTFVTVAEGEDTGEGSLLINAEAGNMIGSPSRKDGGIQVTALLDAGMRPGMAFRVESDQINGDFTAGEVVFSGDSGHSNPFYMTITGTERPGVSEADTGTEGSTFADLVSIFGEGEDADVFAGGTEDFEESSGVTI